MAEFKSLTKPTEASLIEEILLEKEKVDSGIYPPSEVFHIQLDGQDFGPLWLDDLRDCIEGNPIFSPETKIRQYDSEEWQPLFEHPLFQKKKPTLVSSENGQEFYVLREGRKWGPFSSHELKHMAMQKEVIATDMISLDKGFNWKRLCEVEEFDFQSDQREELPPAPGRDVFEHSEREAIESLHYAPKGHEETEAIIGLAYIGQLKSGKVEKTVKEVEEANSEFSSQRPTPATVENRWVYKAMLGISFVALSFIFFNWQKNDKPEMTAKAKTQKKIEKTKKVSANKTKIKPKKVSAKPFRSRPTQKFKRTPSRRPASKKTSFTKSNSFKKARPKLQPKPQKFEDTPKEENDYYYDNGEDPVENDPVRNKISKETLDPELENEGLDEAERDLASEGLEGEEEFFDNEENPEFSDEEAPFEGEEPFDEGF